MSERAVHAVEFAGDHRLSDTTACAQAQVMVELARYLWAAEPSTAAPELSTLVARLDGTTAPVAGWQAHIVAQLCVVDSAKNRTVVADNLRSAVHHLLDETPSTSAPLVIMQVSWVFIRIRWQRSLRDVLDRAVAIFGPTPELAVVSAALACTDQQALAALELVEPVTHHPAHPLVAIPAQLLYAVACYRLDRPTAAYAALGQALELAHADRLIRPFLDVPGVGPLLDHYVGRFGYLDEFVDRIRDRYRAAAGARAPELTRTETVVLRQLPSGMTTQTIATDLGVSVNTVKTHLRGIYHKLGVRARADAITEARAYGLL